MSMRALADADDGVHVRAWDPVDDRIVMSPVTYWMHRMHNVPVTYVHVQTQSGTL
jgi:hypothetical protein